MKLMVLREKLKYIQNAFIPILLNCMIVFKKMIQYILYWNMFPMVNFFSNLTKKIKNIQFFLIFFNHRKSIQFHLKEEKIR